MVDDESFFLMNLRDDPYIARRIRAYGPSYTSLTIPLFQIDWWSRTNQQQVLSFELNKS
jgi:hypothetical protein